MPCSLLKDQIVLHHIMASYHKEKVEYFRWRYVRLSNICSVHTMVLTDRWNVLDDMGMIKLTKNADLRH